MSSRKRKTPKKKAKKVAPNIRRSRKRFIAAGCSHGQFIDSGVADDLIKFKNDFNPHTTLHLGDFLDQTAFRSGAGGTPDEAMDITDDIIKGLHFIERLAPDFLFLGNHDKRAYRLASHPKAIVAHAAQAVVDDINRLAKEVKAELVPYTDVTDVSCWRMLGDIAFGHGFMFGINACEQHVNLLGENVCFVHTHAVDIRTARTHGGKTGYNIGCVADITKLADQYAGQRMKTSTWKNAWAYGEYGDDWCNLQVHTCLKKQQKIPQAS